MKNYIKSFCVLLSLVCCSITNATDSLTAEVQGKTTSGSLEYSHIKYLQWNVRANIPNQIDCKDGIVLRPLRHGDEASEVLVFELHSKQENMVGYADGKRRTIEQFAGIFKRHADRWEQGVLHGGFGVYLTTPDKDIALGIVGIGLSGVDGVGEIFALEKSEHRAKGYGTKTALIMAEWASLLMKNGYKFGQKPLEAVIATSNVNNTPSQSLLAKAGYKPATQADVDLFKGTAIIPEGVEFSVKAAVPSDSWNKEKPLPFPQLGVLSHSRHGNEKALFILRKESQ